ncbi:MAG: acyltransferase [Thermodesulfobacteriota bacterium]|nr:MAG: acyltransferase [Thermodesulfobacteriota bacterium]
MQPIKSHVSSSRSTYLSLSENPRSQEHFGFIDSLRGLAALGIACYHIHRYAPLREPAEAILPDYFEHLVRHGWMGVQVFLVIAGFVTAYSLRNTKITETFFGNFFLRRLVRLGGPYWVVVLLVAILNYFVVSLSGDLSFSGRVTWLQLLSQLTFLQDITRYPNISAGLWFVGIALQWGLAFILLFGAADRVSRNRSPGARGEWIVLLAFFLPPAILALFVFNLESSMDMWIIYFFHMPVFGALAWWTLERRVPTAAFWAYAAILLAGMAFRFRIEIVIAVIVGVTFYRAGQSRGIHEWLSVRPLKYLGRISYSLFLVHYSSGWLVTNLGYRITGDHPHAAVFWLALALVASIGAAHVLYVLVEKPTSNLAARLKPSSRA